MLGEADPGKNRLSILPIPSHSQYSQLSLVKRCYIEELRRPYTPAAFEKRELAMQTLHQCVPVQLEKQDSLSASPIMKQPHKSIYSLRRTSLPTPGRILDGHVQAFPES